MYIVSIRYVCIHISGPLHVFAYVELSYKPTCFEDEVKFSGFPGRVKL